MAKNINSTNYNNIFKCIKVLIAHRADVNIPSKWGCTPIIKIAKNKKICNDKKRKLIEYILASTKVDLDQLRNRKARHILIDTFSDLEDLAQRSTEEFLKNLEQMAYDDEHSEMLENFTSSTEQSILYNFISEIYFNKTLLSVASEAAENKEVEKSLQSGVLLNKSMLVTCSKYATPIAKACIQGNWQILEILLRHPKLDLTKSPLLIIVIKNAATIATNAQNYMICFDLLLKHPGININQKDEFGSTALHYAVKYNNKDVILALLERGAYWGAKNIFGKIPISNVNSNILEDHLNNCVTANDDQCFGGNEYEIRFNYKNLVPPEYNDEKILDFVTEAKPKCYEEMIPIEYMAQSNNLRHLLMHPLIASFLYLKWNRISLIFYINFLLYTLYYVTILAYLTSSFGKDVPKTILAWLYVATTICGMYLLLREIAQFFISPMKYLRNKDNYLEVLLIIMTGFVLYSDGDSLNSTVAAVTILLASCEYFFLTGSLPFLSFSLHLVMFKAVAKTFLKVLLLYSIIIIAFGLCFYILLSDKDVPLKFNDGQNGNEAIMSEIKFKRFHTLFVTFIKTIVMMTGEFDASSINFKDNIWSSLIFLIFVLLISTVLFNLLSALAVSDTQVVKKKINIFNITINKNAFSALY